MIYGTGIDIIEIRRIKNSLKKFSSQFEEKIFTSKEITYCRSKANPAQHFAARFAVKEAAFKSLGTGITGRMSWKDLEVVNEVKSGKPFLKFTKKGQEVLDQLKLKKIHISISHDDLYAIAQAVAET